MTDFLAMNSLKKYLTPLATALIVFSLSSCDSSPDNPQSRTTDSPRPNTTQTASPISPDSPPATPTVTPQKTPATSQSANTTPQAANTITLNIYNADSQCQNLVPEKVAVSADNPAESAVGNVLKQTDSADFELAGYRVQVNPNNGIATVDFRLSPNSRRQFVSLSSCEQFALFGSIRKTLTDNSQLKIKEVRFTEQGQEIVL